jgi:hypothetical protein
MAKKNLRRFEHQNFGRKEKRYNDADAERYANYYKLGEYLQTCK